MRQTFCHKNVTLDLRLTQTDSSSAFLVLVAQPPLNIKITNILKCKQNLSGAGRCSDVFLVAFRRAAALCQLFRMREALRLWSFSSKLLVISAEELLYERISPKVGCRCPLLSHP